VAFLNAGSSSMFDDPRLSSIALGIGSLCIGVLNTLGSYFGWAKRSEGHRISAIHYAKLYRFITVELASASRGAHEPPRLPEVCQGPI
jgi:hypothetical protein